MPIRVAVLGGTLSGTTAARKLAAQGHEVELFRNLFDPARSIHKPHPICEYQAATFVLRQDAPREFVDEVHGWARAGLVEEAQDFRVGRTDESGRFEPMSQEEGSIRYRPTGGFLALVDALCKQLQRTCTIRSPQLAKMAWEDSSGGWMLEDIQGKPFGPYDVVLLAFDQLPRAARKASMKQLLESALPDTSRVIACAGNAQQASSMTVVVEFTKPVDVPWDSLVIDGVPELQLAVRNPKADQLHRGLRTTVDTWTLVATTAWTLQTRPNHTAKWDKASVGQKLIRAFGRLTKCDVSQYRLAVPTFHWQGASGITQVSEGPPCAFDAEAQLGWCGDMFGGLGPAGAVASGCALAGLMAELAAGSPTSVLPGRGAWGARDPRADDDDILCIAGPRTGRQEPADGLDHTWPTAAKLASGCVVNKADSLASYRARGVLAQDRKRAAAGGAHACAGAQGASAVRLRVECADAGGVTMVSGVDVDYASGHARPSVHRREFRGRWRGGKAAQRD